MVPRVIKASVLGCCTVLVGFLACDRTGDASPDASAPPASASAPSATASQSAAPPPPSAPPPSHDANLSILKMTFTEAVENREPVGSLSAAQPGSRVYAHLTVRNRTGAQRTLHVAFLVGGVTRTEVDLKVEPSWSYRTWAYCTLKPSDRTGDLVVELREDSKVLHTATLKIKP